MHMNAPSFGSFIRDPAQALSGQDCGGANLWILMMSSCELQWIHDIHLGSTGCTSPFNHLTVDSIFSSYFSVWLKLLQREQGKGNKKRGERRKENEKRSNWLTSNWQAPTLQSIFLHSNSWRWRLNFVFKITPTNQITPEKGTCKFSEDLIGRFFQTVPF